MVQKNIQKLLDKKMNRKEFLTHVGAGALMVIGVSGLVKNLLDYSGNSKKPTIEGYGSSSYGGTRKS